MLIAIAIYILLLFLLNWNLEIPEGDKILSKMLFDATYYSAAVEKFKMSVLNVN